MILLHYHWTTVAPAPFQQPKAALKNNSISFLLLLKNKLFQQNSVNWKIQHRIIIESMGIKHFTKKMFFQEKLANFHIIVNSLTLMFFVFQHILWTWHVHQTYRLTKTRSLLLWLVHSGNVACINCSTALSLDNCGNVHTVKSANEK